MKLPVFLFFLLGCFFNGRTQNLSSIKTDAECLNFIRKNIDNFDNFYFDTLFTQEQIIKQNIKDPYKNWGILDFNNDKKPDLFFAGKRKVPYTSGYTAELYLSNNKNEYDLIHLSRNLWDSYKPLVFYRPYNSQKFLFVYRISTYDGSTTDSIVAIKQHLYPKGIKAIDTLVYKHDHVINFAKESSKLEFDSLYYKTNWGISGKIYKNGNVSLYQLRGKEIEKTLKAESSTISLLKKLVFEIDLKSTDPDYSSGYATDKGYISLIIYTKGKEITLNDSGLRSTYTLMAIYKLIWLIEGERVEKL